ncbi:hypothetical protein F383_30855 [Gossypium arboreum]|uniref:Uncharacterized protein n=1 Tax=Gossypium arboreum TaxID=29729 RepID=A0A0B0PH79_GOSAR|nr:hypothetical protein F383_30855 [Gossypium arboreum]
MFVDIRDFVVSYELGDRQRSHPHYRQPSVLLKVYFQTYGMYRLICILFNLGYV